MLRGIWAFFVLAIVTTIVSFCVAVVVIPVRRWANVSIHGARIWSRVMVAAVGVRPTFLGLDNVDHGSPQVFIANHQSIVDVWVMPQWLPFNARFAVKQELFRVPIFGWAMAASGFIPINRQNRSEAVKSLDEAASRIRSGCSVVLYPEGTRSRDGNLQPFKKGAFHLALAAGVPVVPVAISGSYDVIRPGDWRVTPGPVTVSIEAPIDVSRFQPDNYQGLLDHVHEVIRRRLSRAPESRPGDAMQYQTS